MQITKRWLCTGAIARGGRRGARASRCAEQRRHRRRQAALPRHVRRVPRRRRRRRRRAQPESSEAEPRAGRYGAGERDCERHSEYGDAAHQAVHRERAGAACRLRAIGREDRTGARSRRREEGRRHLQESRLLVMPHRRRRGRQPRSGSHRHRIHAGRGVPARGRRRSWFVAAEGHAVGALARLRRVPARAHRHRARAAKSAGSGSTKMHSRFRCATRPASSTRCGRAISSCWTSRQGRASCRASHRG